jgi:hypothetical protein
MGLLSQVRQSRDPEGDRRRKNSKRLSPDRGLGLLYSPRAGMEICQTPVRVLA